MSGFPPPPGGPGPGGPGPGGFGPPGDFAPPGAPAPGQGPPPLGAPGPGGFGPPGPAGPFAPPPVVARRPAQPLRGLAVAVMVLLGVVALISLGRMGAFLVRADAVDGFLNEGLSSVDEIDNADDLVAATTIFYALGVVVTGVVFIVWQFRHATNAEALGGRMGLGPGWAIGGWFVPLANWVLAAVQLTQASRATDPGPSPSPASGRARALIIVWAALLGLGIVLSWVGQVTWPQEEEIVADVGKADDAVTSDRIDAVGALAFAASAALGAVMVWSLTTAQEQRLAGLPAGGAPGYGYGPPPAAPPGWGVPPAPAAPPPAWPQPPPRPPGSGF